MKMEYMLGWQVVLIWMLLVQEYGGIQEHMAGIVLKVLNDLQYKMDNMMKESNHMVTCKE